MITEYLLVYKVSVLNSLNTVFPNLAVIGGVKLFNTYSMVLFDNSDLTEVKNYCYLSFYIVFIFFSIYYSFKKFIFPKAFYDVLKGGSIGWSARAMHIHVPTFLYLAHFI